MKHEYYVELLDGKDRPVGFRVIVDPMKIALSLSRRALKSGSATALSGAVVVHKADTFPSHRPPPALEDGRSVQHQLRALGELPSTVPRAFNSGPRSAADTLPAVDPHPWIAKEIRRQIPADTLPAKQRLAQTKLERAQNRDQDRDDAKVSAGTTKGRQRPGKGATIDPEPAIPYRWPTPADFADKKYGDGKGWSGESDKGKY